MVTDYEIQERLRLIEERIKQVPKPPRINATELAKAIRLAAKRALRNRK